MQAAATQASLLVTSLMMQLRATITTEIATTIQRLLLPCARPAGAGQPKKPEAGNAGWHFAGNLFS